jgi:hypothetical protein
MCVRLSAKSIEVLYVEAWPHDRLRRLLTPLRPQVLASTALSGRDLAPQGWTSFLCFE